LSPARHRPEVVHHLDQGRELFQRRQRRFGTAGVHTLVQLDADERRRHRPRQPRCAGEVGERRPGKQPIQHPPDLGDPQPQRRRHRRRRREPRLALRTGQQLGRYRDVAEPLLLGVDLATGVEQLTQ
jgi:hypothetical protein